MQCSGHAVHGGDGGVELPAVVIRAIAAHGPPDLEPADLAEVVRASASHVVGPGEVGRIFFDAPDAVVIRMDPEQIERVVTTCSGTLCSMHRGRPRFESRFGRGAGDPVVSVADEGPGIAPEALGWLFERYQQR